MERASPDRSVLRIVGVGTSVDLFCRVKTRKYRVNPSLDFAGTSIIRTNPAGYEDTIFNVV